MDRMPQPGDFRGEPAERYWTAIAEWYRQRAFAAESKLDAIRGRIEGMRQLTRENLAKGYCDDSRAHAMMEVFDIIEKGPPT